MQKIKTRNELPLLLNDLNLIGKGVEVGVERGEYSEIILQNSNLSILYSIDSWKEFSKEEYKDINNHNQKKHNQNKKETEQRLRKYKDRSQVWQMLSEDAAAIFKNNSLDFVYIDANHSYEGCKIDIELWYPKIKQGGVLAGHDYIEDGQYSEGKFGVKGAVDEFVKKYDLELLTTMQDSWASWCIIKKPKKNILVVTHERSGTHLAINIINNENDGLFKAIGRLPKGTSNSEFNLKGYQKQINQDLFKTDYSQDIVLKSHHQVEFFQDNIEKLFEKYHVVYVLRDVKDVLVSYYKFLKEGLPKFPEFKEWIFMKPCDVGYEYFETLPDPHIYIEPKDYIERWKMHRDGWMKYKDKMLVIRYEDILQNFEDIKNKLETFLNKKVANQIPKLGDERLPHFSFNKGIIDSHLEYMDNDLITTINNLK